MGKRSSMPKRLFVVEDAVEQATHIGNPSLNELVIWTDKPKIVGEYKLVRTTYQIGVSFEGRQEVDAKGNPIGKPVIDMRKTPDGDWVTVTDQPHLKESPNA